MPLSSLIFCVFAFVLRLCQPSSRCTNQILILHSELCSLCNWTCIQPPTAKRHTNPTQPLACQDLCKAPHIHSPNGLISFFPIYLALSHPSHTDCWNWTEITLLSCWSGDSGSASYVLTHFTKSILGLESWLTNKWTPSLFGFQSPTVAPTSPTCGYLSPFCHSYIPQPSSHFKTTNLGSSRLAGPILPPPIHTHLLSHSLFSHQSISLS